MTLAKHKQTSWQHRPASASIGQIAASNGHYTDGLARRIDATGKSVGQLTVAELMHLHVTYKIDFNRIHGN